MSERTNESWRLKQLNARSSEKRKRPCSSRKKKKLRQKKLKLEMIVEDGKKEH